MRALNERKCLYATSPRTTLTALSWHIKNSTVVVGTYETYLTCLEHTNRCLDVSQTVVAFPAYSPRKVAPAYILSHLLLWRLFSCSLLFARLSCSSCSLCALAVVRPFISRQPLVAHPKLHQFAPIRHGSLHHSSRAHRAVEPKHARGPGRRSTEPQERDCWP
jgi:hypothetical protein